MLNQIVMTMANLGPAAPLVFVPLYILGTLVFVPGWFMGLAAGALFGAPAGFALASFSSLASAAGVFLAGRKLSRNWILKKIAAHKKFRALDEVVAKKGWKMVFLLRFSSIMPFSVMNYGLGLSKIGFKPYIFGTLFGMMPVTLLYVYLGAVGGKMLFGKGERQPTFIEGVFSVLGLVVTIGMTLYAASAVRKTFKEQA